MKNSMFGVLAASAVASLIGSAALAGNEPMGSGSDAQGCYRTHCGKSIESHEGKCGGTKVQDVTDQKACEGLGGAWTTETDAEKFKKKG